MSVTHEIVMQAMPLADASSLLPARSDADAILQRAMPCLH
jgi:hypothetical protein